MHDFSEDTYISSEHVVGSTWLFCLHASAMSLKMSIKTAENRLRVDLLLTR